MSKAILQTMQITLQGQNTQELKEACFKTCKIVSEAMISDNYLKSSTNDQDAEVESSEGSDELNLPKIKLVQESWLQIKQLGLQEFGVQLFKTLF